MSDKYLKFLGMNKIWWIVVIVLTIGILGYVGYVYFTLRYVPVPSPEESWTKNNLVVLDSLENPDNTRKAYTFIYDTGSFGYSAAMVTIAGTIDQITYEDAILISDYLSKVEWKNSKKLIIYLSRDNYKMVKCPKSINVDIKINK